MAGRLKNLREMVVTSRRESGEDSQQHAVPLQYGRKRTLKPIKPRTDTDYHAARASLKTPAHGFDLDRILACVDVSFINSWLQRTATTLESLQEWWSDEDNAMAFTHFWLSEFSDAKREELLIMEHEILTAELQTAFQVGLRNKEITELDVAKLLRAVFREYPNAFSEGDGTQFIDLLRVLVMGQGTAYRSLLAQIRCTTKNESHIQWLLAIRSFALFSVVSAITNFFREFSDRQDTLGLPRPGTSRSSRPPPTARPPTSTMRPLSSAHARPRTSRPRTGSKDSLPGIGQSAESELPRRPTTAAGARTCVAPVDDLFHAIKKGYSDVVYYMLSRGIVPIDAVDGQGRTILFVAVLHRHEDLVTFLLENADLFDVNQCASSGNTPLHAAATNGDVIIGQMLLMANATVNPVNDQSGATPRIIADMHGHTDFVALIDRYTD